MKIAIVSDSHDNLPNIDEMLRIVKDRKLEAIIHCGDVGAPSVTKYIAENFNGKIYLAQGNVDGDHQKKMDEFNLKQVICFDEIGEVELDNKKFAFCHYPKIAKELTESGKYDLVFYGHTHEPWEKKTGNTRMVNPGTLAGLFAKPTFAIYDTQTDNLELILLYQS